VLIAEEVVFLHSLRVANNCPKMPTSDEYLTSFALSGEHESGGGR
jgi:hypothetical protein